MLLLANRAMDHTLTTLVILCLHENIPQALQFMDTLIEDEEKKEVLQDSKFSVARQRKSVQEVCVGGSGSCTKAGLMPHTKA